MTSGYDFKQQWKIASTQSQVGTTTYVLWDGSREGQNWFGGSMNTSGHISVNRQPLDEQDMMVVLLPQF